MNMHKYFATLTIVAGSLCSRAVLAQSTAPATCDSESQVVEAEAAGEGWLVTRTACPGEREAVLTYAHGKEVPGRALGKLVGSKWTFSIPEAIADDAVVRLEFSVYQALDAQETEQAKQATTAFAAELTKAVETAFADAEAATRGVADERRQEVLLATFNDKLRTKVRSLLASAPLSKVFEGSRRASEVVLERVGFRRVADGDYEPTPATYQALQGAWHASERARWNRASTVTAYESAGAYDACLGQPRPLTVPDATVEQRQLALKTCLTQFHGFSSQALPAPSEQQKKALSKLKALLEKAPAALADELVASDPKVTANLKLEYETAINEIRASLPQTRPPAEIEAEKKAGRTPVLVPAATTAAYSAAGAMEYAAALVRGDRDTKASWQAALAQKLEIDGAALRSELRFTRQGRASELVRVVPGKPRFFVSTGVLATSLGNGDWKASLPVLVSICWSVQGCETKGVGSGGSWANYVSTDVGVKAFFIGDRDARESTPSFLLGLGVTPIYALHVGAGVNLFENAQTDRVNVAPYIGATLDLIDGKDILGQLGLGKPDVEVIGKKEEKSK